MIHIWTILAQSIDVGLVIAFVLFIKWLFQGKLSPKWQYTIWIVVLFRAIVPSTSNLGWFVGNLSTWVEMNLNSAYFPLFGRENSLLSVPDSITDWLFVAYLGWVLSSAVYFLGSYLRLRKRVGKGVPVCGEICYRVDELAKQENLPVPDQILESRTVSTPFLLGVGRPVLVLPMGAEIGDSVLLHELFHLKYQDVLAGWVTTILRCFYPIFWPIWDRVDNDRERACDQRVLERLEGEDRRNYGHILLSMVDDTTLHTPGATTMANGGKNIRHRIEDIANFRKFPQGMGLVSLCMVVILSLNLVLGDVFATEGHYQSHAGTFPYQIQAISYGQRNPATTVAGALDAYSKGVYDYGRNLTTRLADFASCTDPADYPDLLAQYEQEREGNRMEQIDYAFQTGPYIRNFEMDGQGGYYAELWMFRDIRYGMEEGYEELPAFTDEVKYQKHFLHLVELDGRWTVTPLEIQEGAISAEEPNMNDTPTTVRWVGEYEGLKITLYNTNEVAVQKARINGYTLPYQYLLSDYGDFTYEPDLDANFTEFSRHFYVEIENIGDEIIGDLEIRVSAWDDFDTAVSFYTTEDEPPEERILGRGYDLPLAPGEAITQWSSGGSISHANSIASEDLELISAPYAEITQNGEIHRIDLIQEVVLP